MPITVPPLPFYTQASPLSPGVRFMGEGYRHFTVAQRVEEMAIEFKTSQLLQVNTHIM